MNSGFIGADQRATRNGVFGLDKMYLQCLNGQWSPFTPASQDGVLAWYDASSAASVSLATGTSVSRWSSRAVVANNANDTGGGAKPTYGSFVTFVTSTSDYLLLDTELTAVRSVFFVDKHAIGSSSGYEFLFGSPSSYDFHGTTGIGLFDSSFASSSVTGGTGYLNGTSVGSPTNLTKSMSLKTYCVETTGNVRIGQITGDRGGAGGDRIWNGSFAEIIICDRVYDATVRTQFNNYLKAKWGT